MSTNVDIPDDESGMAKDILFKPRPEAAKHDRKLDIIFTVQESVRTQKLHLSDMYVVFILC